MFDLVGVILRERGGFEELIHYSPLLFWKEEGVGGLIQAL